MRLSARYILINPLLVVALTFGGGFLFWYFGMMETSVVPGIAARHEPVNGLFLFFLFFAAFVGGMTMAQSARRSASVAAYISDSTWLQIGWAMAAIVLLADYLYVRSGIATIQAMDAASYTSTIHEFAGAVRENSAFGITSLNNLFPLPLVIGAAITVTRRPVGRAKRWQGAVMFGIILLMTLAHGVAGFGRIWFLFSIMAAFVVWVLERHPSLRLQIAVLVVGGFVAGTFIIVMELMRNAGLTAQATNLQVTDPRILRLVFLTLTQAYVASDVNNAMIVFDCQPPINLVSTIDVLVRPLQNIGLDFRGYADCTGWTSMFGTINFFATVWWDWGWAGIPLVSVIGYGIQRSYRAAFSASPGLAIGEVLFPNVLFGTAHLTRTGFLGSTEFLLPASVLLIFYLLYRLGTRSGDPIALGAN